MEITSLDLVEGDMSISEIQTQSPARRRIAMNARKCWREHYTRRLFRYEIRGSVITMVVNGSSVRPSNPLVEPESSLMAKDGVF